MKKYLHFIVYPFVFISVLASPFTANSETEAVSFDEVLQIAMQNSLAIKQIEQEISKIQAEGQEVRLFQNPEIIAEIRPFIHNQGKLNTESEISFTQPFKISNFGARKRIAKLLDEIADIESKILLVQFEQTVVLAYSKVWLLEQRSSYLRNLIKRTENLLAKIITASHSGLLPASTNKLLLSEQKRLKVERDGVLADKQKALSELVKVVGINISASQFKEITFEELPNSIWVDQQIPLVQRIKTKMILAAEQRNLARLDAFPEFSPKIGFDHTAEGDDRIIIGFSLPLPLFNRNQAEKIKAEVESATQMAMQRYIEQGAFEEEINLLIQSAKSSVAQARHLKLEVLTILEDAYNAAEREVFAGQGSPLQLWQVLTEMRELQERYLELWIKGVANRAELSMLLGKSF